MIGSPVPAATNVLKGTHAHVPEADVATSSREQSMATTMHGQCLHHAFLLRPLIALTILIDPLAG